MKKVLTVALTIILLIVVFFGWQKLVNKTDKTVTPAPTVTAPPKDTATADSSQFFDKQQFSIDQPSSPWWVVNKTRPLPDGYVPEKLVVPAVTLRLSRDEEQMQIAETAVRAVEEMFAAAKQGGVGLVFGSGYRSLVYQKTLYNGYIVKYGQAEADRISARPGTSEHQTGLSFDATSASKKCHLEKCFADLPEGQWLAKNAYKYGFVMRYLQGKETITGYDYEPWHFRYVGKELANEIYKNGQTLEEFFDLPPAKDYKN